MPIEKKLKDTWLRSGAERIKQFAPEIRKQDKPGAAFENIQKAVGNIASGNQLRQQTQAVPCKQLVKGMREPFARIVKLLTETSGELQSELWLRFAQLTVEQRQAALLYAAGSDKEVEQLIQNRDRWYLLGKGIDALHGVRLRQNESVKEGSIYESGALDPHQTADVQIDDSGLAPLHKTVVRWLVYKANKQGEKELMRRFGRLTAVRQMKLINRLNGGTRIRFTEFTKTITVEKQFKKWVDWSLFSQMLAGLEQEQQRANQKETSMVADNDADSDTISLLKAKHDRHMPKDSTSEWMEDESGLDNTPTDVHEKQVSSSKRQQDSREGEQDEQDGKLPNQQISTVPLPLPAIARNQKFSKELNAARIADVLYGGKQTPYGAVCRYLGVAEGSSARQMRVVSKRLKKEGYVSVQHCYIELLKNITAVLYQSGVLRGRPEYRAIIAKLGLFRQYKAPEKKQIAKRLGLPSDS